MGFTYQLLFPNGDDAGTFESSRSDWRPGDDFRGDGNVLYRIRAVIPLPLIEEFVDRPLYGCWEVERLGV
jgi:hypothetical protein